MAKYLKKPAVSKPKVNIPMCVAGILFVLTMVSMHLTSGLYARYTASSSGEDSARVIKFGQLEIVETGDFVLDKNGNSTGKMMIIPGVPIEKQAFVSFSGSEAATYVFVEVTPSAHWEQNKHYFYKGTYMDWQIDEDWKYLTKSGNTSVFYQPLAPNKTLTNEPVIVNGVINVGADLGKAAMSSIQKVNGEVVDISVTFRASVVQANGFDSVQAAWASLESKGGAA